MSGGEGVISGGEGIIGGGKEAYNRLLRYVSLL